jgi:hypothetical protein
MKLPTNLTRETIIDAAKRGMVTLDSPGFCIVCGHESDGVEPDMRNGPCESCGESAVMGAEELMFWLF